VLGLVSPPLGEVLVALLGMLDPHVVGENLSKASGIEGMRSYRCTRGFRSKGSEKPDKFAVEGGDRGFLLTLFIA